MSEELFGAWNVEINLCYTQLKMCEEWQATSESWEAAIFAVHTFLSIKVLCKYREYFIYICRLLGKYFPYQSELHSLILLGGWRVTNQFVGTKHRYVLRNNRASESDSNIKSSVGLLNPATTSYTEVYSIYYSLTFTQLTDESNKQSPVEGFDRQTIPTQTHYK